MTRDADNNPTVIDAANGAVAELTYDSLGNPVLIRAAVGTPVERQTVLEYEQNRVSRVVDPEARETLAAYDEQGNLSDVTHPDRSRTVLRYESENCPGKLTSITTAFGLPEESTITLEYDSLTCNVSRIVDGLGGVTTFHYDSAGNVIQVCDGLGRITRLEWDAHNRVVKIIDPSTVPIDRTCGQIEPSIIPCPEPGSPAEGVTCFTYDENGNMRTITDARGCVSTFLYGALDRLEARVDRLGFEETFEYDANGNLVLFTSRNGVAIEYRYDAENRLIEKDVAPESVDAETTSFAYDEADNLISIVDPDSALAMTYDVLNRITSVTTAGSPTQPEILLEYS